jgi:hypothetical protein
METVFLVSGCLSFGSGCLFAVLASCIPYRLVDEINDRSTADQKVDTFHITETILRRHQQLYPGSPTRRLMNAAMISAVLMMGAGVCLLLDYSSLHDLNRSQVIAPRQQSTIGTLTGGPAGRDSYGYSFSVGDGSYDGWGPVYGHDTKIGQQVRVYYDPNDPTVNALARFEYSRAKRDWSLGIGIVIAFFVVAGGVVSVKACWRYWGTSGVARPGTQ